MVSALDETWPTSCKARSVYFLGVVKSRAYCTPNLFNNFDIHISIS